MIAFNEEFGRRKTEGEALVEASERYNERKRGFLKKIGLNVLGTLREQTLLALDDETQLHIIENVRRALEKVKDTHGGIEQFNEEFNSLDHWVPEVKQMVIEAVSRDEDVKSYFEPWEK